MIKLPKLVPTLFLSRLKTPHQLSIAFNSIPLQGMTPCDRAKALSHLAILLMQASGVATGESDDDER